MRLLHWLSSVLFLTAVSCSMSNGLDEGVEAVVNGKSLFSSEVAFALPKGLSAEDSLAMAQKYVRNWVVDQMMYDDAQNSVENTDYIEMMVQEYKQSLYVFDYQNQLMKSKMNTSVSDEQVSMFFSENEQSLKLAESLFKGYLIVAPSSLTDLKTLKSKMMANEMDEVEQICVRAGLTPFYFLNDWTLASEIRKKGFLTLNTSASYTPNKLIDVKMDDYVVLFYVMDCTPAGQTQPFEYAQDFIKRVLVEHRKTSFVDSLREAYYQKAISTGMIAK